MTVPSFEKVHYELRPAKQVERRMFLETFQAMMSAGFPISRYKYTGMGSVYFIDYMMFHRYLGIRRMLSVEKSRRVKKRVEFNKPFGLVDIEIDDIANQIAALSPDVKHILWLDYDNILDKKVLHATRLAMENLSPGSIFLLTVDAEPPGGNGPRDWMDHFESQAMSYMWANPKIEEFTKKRLVAANIKILRTVINSALSSRSEVTFAPLFNILYGDGHEMLTIGGVVADKWDRQKLQLLNNKDLPYLRKSLGVNPYKIRIPLVTRKERLYLNSNMPCSDSWKPSEFEMKKADVMAYREIYKYYPAFAEMLF